MTKPASPNHIRFFSLLAALVLGIAASTIASASAASASVSWAPAAESATLAIPSQAAIHAGELAFLNSQPRPGSAAAHAASRAAAGASTIKLTMTSSSGAHRAGPKLAVTCTGSSTFLYISIGADLYGVGAQGTTTCPVVATAVAAQTQLWTYYPDLDTWVESGVGNAAVNLNALSATSQVAPSLCSSFDNYEVVTFHEVQFGDAFAEGYSGTSSTSFYCGGA